MWVMYGLRIVCNDGLTHRGYKRDKDTNTAPVCTINLYMKWV